MKGWLVVNGFLKSDKFQNLYKFFQNSAQQLNIQLSLVTSDSLACAPKNSDSKPDFVLFWDKDTVLAKNLERSGLRLFNSARAVEVCDSKTLTALCLDGIVPMPQTLFSPKTFEGVGYPNLDFVQRACEHLGLPMVIKECYGSFGQQVYLAETVQQAREIVLKLVGKDFIFQKFVSTSRGRDIRVNVVGGKAVNAILRYSQNGDFRSNITLGGAMQRHILTDAERQLAEETCRVLGLDFAGVDILFGPDGPLLCEVNSNPHFLSTFQCTGVDLSKNILQWISQKISE